MTRNLVIAVLLLFPACVGTAPQPCKVESALALCDVLGSAEYRDKEVTVHAKYQETPEYALLFGDGCHGFVSVRYGEHYKESSAGSRSLRRLLRKSPNAVVEVVVRGRFRAAAAGTCFGAGCASYELSVDEFLCVDAAPHPRPTSTNADQ
jgi:hypothetical protein